MRLRDHKVSIAITYLRNFRKITALVAKFSNIIIFIYFFHTTPLPTSPLLVCTVQTTFFHCFEIAYFNLNIIILPQHLNSIQMIEHTFMNRNTMDSFLWSRGYHCELAYLLKYNCFHVNNYTICTIFIIVISNEVIGNYEVSIPGPYSN